MDDQFQVTGLPLSDDEKALLKSIALALIKARGDAGAMALGNLAWFVENEGRTTVTTGELKDHAVRWRG